MTTITYEDAKRVLTELAAERPDYVYERPRPAGVSQREKAHLGPVCRYSDYDGQPSCIVGHLLYRLDPAAFERLAAWEGMEEKSTGVGRALWIVGVQTEAGVSGLLATVQAEQDSGRPWAAAVEYGVQGHA